MKKVIRYGFPIACVVIIGGTFYMLGNLGRKVEGSLKSQYNNNVNSIDEINDEINSSENLIENDVTYTVPVDTSENENIIHSENSIENESSNEIENNISNENLSNRIGNSLE